MYYTKLESYAFTMPEEYTAYLKFKDDLKDEGIKFTETGGMRHQIIEIRTTGNFKKFGEGGDK